MSQVFDSLRRDANASPRRHVPRLAHGDAVLATLGYARVARRPFASALVALVLMLGIVGIGWAGWIVYKRSMPARPASGVRPAALAAPRPPAKSDRRYGVSPSAGQLDLARETLLKALMTAREARRRITILDSCTTRPTSRRAPSSTTAPSSRPLVRNTRRVPLQSEPG